MSIKSAIEAPVTIHQVHESCYKSSRTLEVVVKMLERKDSHETILQVINTIYQFVPKDQQSETR